MTGLRERKKRQVRHRLIATAARLFAEQGIDATTMEEIAAAADVSVGTVYNYFGTKNRLLVAGLEEDTDAMIAAGAAVVGDPGPDPMAAIQRLFGVYVDHFTAWEPRLLREVFSAAFRRTGGEELTTELFALDRRLIEQAMGLLAHYQASGSVRSDVAAHEATVLLFSTFVTQLFIHMGLEGSSPSDLRARLERQIALAFSGLGSSERARTQ